MIGNIRPTVRNNPCQPVKYCDNSALKNGVEKKVEMDVSGRKMVNKTEI